MRRLTLLIFLTTLFVAAISGGQMMQKGISVELPVTHGAVPMPDADRQDALIVAVTANGRVFFGISPTAPEALTEKVRGRLSDRTQNEVYIKADGRTRYANVMKMLDAIRTAGIKQIALLTAQQELSPVSTPALPKGLQVLLEWPTASSSEPAVVQVLSSGEQWPMLKVNNDIVAWDVLHQKLTQLAPNGGEKTVALDADGQLSFAQVADVIDICHGAGVNVVLVMNQPRVTL